MGGDIPQLYVHEQPTFADIRTEVADGKLEATIASCVVTWVMVCALVGG